MELGPAGAGCCNEYPTVIPASHGDARTQYVSCTFSVNALTSFTFLHGNQLRTIELVLILLYRSLDFHAGYVIDALMAFEGGSLRDSYS